MWTEVSLILSEMEDAIGDSKAFVAIGPTLLLLSCYYYYWHHVCVVCLAHHQQGIRWIDMKQCIYRTIKLCFGEMDLLGLFLTVLQREGERAQLCSQ